MARRAHTGEADALALEVLRSRDVGTADDVESRHRVIGGQHHALRCARIRGHADDGRAAATDIDVAETGADEILRYHEARAAPDRFGGCRGDVLVHVEAITA